MAAEKDSWTSQIRKGVLELAVLGLLDSAEMYGFEIVSALSARPALAITAGTIYPLLNRLKRAGLIASAWRESPVGPPRKYYHLTESGGKEYAEMRLAWAAVAGEMAGLLEGSDTA